MRLRDLIYLRFFLFHQRYGRFWAALLEGVCVFVAVCILMGALWVLWGATMLAAQHVIDKHTERYKQEAANYQATLIKCLNGGIIGKAGDEVITCQGAVTFKFGRLR
jgi:hypothetical protein